MTADVSIRGRVVSALGEVLGTSDIVISQGPELADNYNPAVAYAFYPDRYLVVWERRVVMGMSGDIEGQVIYAGAVEGDNILIAKGDWDYDHTKPAVAYNLPANQFLVAWEREDKDAHIYDICGQRMTGEGTPQGPLLLIAYFSVNSTSPAVATLRFTADQHYLVVWEFEYTPGDRHIFGQLVAGDGSMSPGFWIGWADVDETTPAVAGTYYGRKYLVTWRRPSYPPYVWTYVHGRNVPTGGSPLGPEMRLGGVQAGRPAVTEGGSGDFLVVYDDQPLLGDRGIYGRLWGNRIYLPLVLR